MTERVPTDDDLPTGWRRPFVRFWLRYEWRGVAVVGVVALLLAACGGWSLLNRDAPTQMDDRTNSYVFGDPSGWHASLDCVQEGLLKDRPFEGTCVQPDHPATADPLAGAYVAAGRPPTGSASGPGPVARALAGRLVGYEPCGQPVVDGANATLCLSGAAQRGELRVKVGPAVVLVVLCVRTDVPGISHGCDDVWRDADMRNGGTFDQPLWG
jgi:hypothetical protein